MKKRDTSSSDEDDEKEDYSWYFGDYKKCIKNIILKSENGEELEQGSLIFQFQTLNYTESMIKTMIFEIEHEIYIDIENQYQLFIKEYKDEAKFLNEDFYFKINCTKCYNCVKKYNIWKVMKSRYFKFI
jgi:hypothetical protein